MYSFECLASTLVCYLFVWQMIFTFSKRLLSNILMQKVVHTNFEYCC